MQHSGIKKLSVLAVLIVSLCLTAVLAPVQQASAATTSCIGRQFSTKSKDDVCVSYIQRMLNINDGSVLAIDNDFGPKTKAEVQFYQTSQKIASDGIVGPNTWGKLCAAQAKYVAIARNAGCAITTASATGKKITVLPKLVSASKQRDAKHGCDAATYRQGSKGTCVKYIQQMFNTLQPSTKLVVDGIYGPKTAELVQAWQQGFKVKGDTSGVLGTNTWDSICFWDGTVPANGKPVPSSILTPWTAAAKKAGCNL